MNSKRRNKSLAVLELDEVRMHEKSMQKHQHALGSIQGTMNLAKMEEMMQQKRYRTTQYKEMAAVH